MRASSIASAVCFVSVAVPSWACAASYNLTSAWSDAANPNGVWTYREGNNALPHVNSWQSSLGGWTSAQPGWAKSENCNDRLPFWFKSNGSENFVHDWLAGDVVVHSTDTTNGVGSGPANVAWTSPENGVVTISGGVWLGRDIGRSNQWDLLKNGTSLTGGTLTTGDPYSRATPFLYSAGTNGAAAVTNIPVTIGDVLQLRFQTTSAGEFNGVNLTFTTAVPEPTALAAAAVFGMAALRRRRAT